MRRETVQAIAQAVLGLWLLWILGQYVLTSGPAEDVLQAQLREIKAQGFDALVSRAGQGYVRREITHDGKTYWFGLAVTSIKGVPGQEGVNQLTASAYVHYLRVVPFLPWTLGSSTDVTMTTSPPAGPSR